MSEKFANQRAATTLDGSILAADTTLVVADASGLPDDGVFRIILGQGPLAEIVQVGDISGTTLTGLVRGSEGTTPRDWPNNTAVAHILTAAGFQAALNDGVATAATYADTGIATHNSDTTSVHGIADTSALETTTGSQAKVDTGVTTAEGYTDTHIATHEGDTTNIHGITNTASLETTTGAQTKADAAATAAEGYADTKDSAHAGAGDPHPGYRLESAAIGTTDLADDSVTTGKLANLSTDRLLGRDTAGTGDPEQLTVGGGLEFSGSGGIQRSALTGEVTATAGSNATTVAGTHSGSTHTSLAKSGSTALHGDVTLSEGSNVSLTQSGQNIAITSLGGTDTAAMHQPGSVSAENDYAAVGDDATANDTAFSNAITAMVAAGKNTLLVGNGIFRFSSDLIVPNMDNFTIQGRGRTKTVLSFASGKGIKSPQNTRLFYHKIADLWVSQRTAATGTGIDFGGVDRSVIERVRVTNFSTGVKIHDVSNTLDTHHNVLYDPVITACTTGVYITGGAAHSANDGEIYGGDISSNGTGVLVDSANINAWQMFGTCMESNTLALDLTSTKCLWAPGRFENNTNDVAFRAGGGYNRVISTMVDPTKIIDATNATYFGSNEIDSVGFATTNSNQLPREFVESFSPLCVPSTNAGDTGALVPEAPNQAYFVRILPQRYHRIIKLDILPITSAGNIDVGVVDANSGTLLASSGSVAMSGSGSTVQTLTLDDDVFLFPGRQYYFVVAFSSASAVIYGSTLNLVNSASWVAAAIEGLQRTRTKATMFPLSGKSFASLSGSPLVPYIAARST